MNTEGEKKPRHRQGWIITVLVVLFALPFGLSWVLFNYTEFGRGDATTSHGQLIMPPRLLTDAQLFDPDELSNKSFHLREKWSLVYLVNGDCETGCEQNLYRMRQIRLAMGKDADRVQRVLINFGAKPVKFNHRQKQDYSGQLFLHDSDNTGFVAQFRLSDEDAPATAGRLYIVDPRGFLMMSYSPDADPAGIIKDLKHLLRYSRVG